MFTNERCIIFDESGNLGTDGRYFVIACIDTIECKQLHNVMKNKLRQAKTKFPELSVHSHEIKASEAYPCIKHHILESIAKKNVRISFIASDISHIDARLLKDKNILYNYLAKLLIDKIVTNADRGSKINIIWDNKTTKVASANSFKEYITVWLNYERQLDLDLNIISKDSNAGDSYIVQAADYVANSIYTFYEYGNSLYKEQIDSKIHIADYFPSGKFGK